MAWLKELVRSGDRPELWTDFFESNIGMKIMRMIAANGALQAYMDNYTQQEMFLATCQEYASGLKHASTNAYSPRRKTASSLTLTAVTLPAQLTSQNLSFASGTDVKIDDLTFQLVDDYTFLAGTSAAYPTGSVQLIGIPDDADKVIAYDGFNLVTFEFDNNGTYGNDYVPVTIGATIPETIVNFITAFNSNATIQMVAGAACRLVGATITASKDCSALSIYDDDPDKILLLKTQPTDGDTITLSDATQSVTFEFDDNASVDPANTAVTIGADVLATNTNLDAAIDGSVLAITSTATTDTATLYHDYQMPLGNQPLEKEGSDIVVTGMSGGTNVEISVSNSQAQFDSFNSDGSAFQSFTTTQGDVLEDSWTVKVGSIEWTEVDSVLLAAATEVYEATLTADGNLVITFGDGNTGKIPASGKLISVDYRTGGGAGGEVLTGAADGTQVQGYFGADGAKIVFTNYFPSSGGADEETLAELRVNIPAWTRTVDKAITAEDYTTLSEQFEDPDYGAVARAYVELHNSNGGATPPTDPNINRVDIYIWTQTGNTFTVPSEGLKVALYRYLHERRVICTQAYVLDGKMQTVNIDLGTVTVDDQYDLAEVEDNIENAVADFFSAADFQPGDAFRISRFYDTISDVAGVLHFTLVAPAADVVPAGNEWLLVPGTITMTLQYAT
jgi:hypothetical protein